MHPVSRQIIGQIIAPPVPAAAGARDPEEVRTFTMAQVVAPAGPAEVVVRIDNVKIAEPEAV
ncbi:MAG TPA: hypothetical protein VFQ45_07165 [Longimicrobium sp.]|nr:hypothetical protein [Longimicrobium sp.]